MLHELVIEGTLVNPDRLDEAQISIDQGYITALRKQGLQGEETLRVPGCLIFPGFIDLHAHLREDASHAWDYKEDFSTGTRAALHGGLTTVVDMPNTPLQGINADRIRAKRELAHSRAACDLLFCGGVTDSNLDALAAMRAEVVAYKIYLVETAGLYLADELLPQALQVIASTSRPVIIHCEDQGIITKRFTELRMSGEGKQSVTRYAELRPEEAELAAVRRVLASVETTEHGPISIAHVSVSGTVDLVEQAACKTLHCEVTPHHLFFTEEDAEAQKAFLKTNPPVRTEANRQGLLSAVKAGKISFLATDHAPHTKEEKAGGLLDAPAGVPNLDTYGCFVAWLIACCGVHPLRVAELCSSRPARFLGLHDRGRIEVGKRADLTILDMQKQTTIRSDRLYTKCGWSPFEGYTFPGTVRHTICHGVVASEYDEVKP